MNASGIKEEEKCKQILSALQKPRTVLPSQSNLIEQRKALSQEQGAKTRRRSCVALCIPLHFELSNCCLPAHQEHRVRFTAILTSIGLCLLAKLLASSLHYSSRKGMREEISVPATGLVMPGSGCDFLFV